MTLPTPTGGRPTPGPRFPRREDAEQITVGHAGTTLAHLARALPAARHSLFDSAAGPGATSSSSRALRFGRYRVVREIGGGGFGSVYEAVDETLERLVAIKTVRAGHLSERMYASMFEREARVQAALSHPSVCPVFDFGNHEGVAFLVMQMIRGSRLRDLIRTAPTSRAGVDAIVALFAQVARGLQAAHDHGIAHRDVKPENILVASDGRAILIDFGVFGSLKGDSQEFAGGTPLYMSPEQWDGLPARKSDDIWAVGVCLFEALTGRRPFDGISHDQLKEQVKSNVAGKPTALNKALPRALDEVILRALHKSPADRYPSAESLAEDLERVRSRQRPLARWFATPQASGPIAFICYRRADSLKPARRLCRWLRRSVLRGRIFIDDEIDAGRNWTKELQGTIENAACVISVIGPSWLTLRLVDEDDWVRKELETARARNVPIIPVLVGNASAPSDDDLSAVPSLQFLASLNARRWPEDARHVVRAIQEHGLAFRRRLFW